MALVKKAGVSEKPPVRVMQANLEAAMTKEHSSSNGSRLAAESQKRKARTFARQQKAAERVASAASQMATGIQEAASAAEELRKASDQIAAGAEEAANAAQQSLKAVTSGSNLIIKAKINAETSVKKTEALQGLVAEVAAQVANSITAIGRASERQEASVKMVEELERQAATIGEVVKAVARIADQTNLLALNAAIEAARAGQHGKGFAVVADEVRTLAETSEKSARDIQELIAQIQKDVKVIAEGINASAVAARQEVEKGMKITETLESVRVDMIEVMKGGREIALASDESNTAAQEALKGSEAVAAAAEEQGSACQEAGKTVEQQTTALAQCEQASQEIAELAEELKNSTNIGKSAEEVASAAEELSSAVEEINRAAAQIMTALEQIGKGAQQQAAATQQSSAAISQIEKGALTSQSRAQMALEKGQAISDTLAANKIAVDALVEGVGKSVEAGKVSRDQISALEQVSRRIDKIVDAITTVSIQTNMLAVNGSVEAARAGEFGKGFAVVSTDIRNLARDSAENADRIKDTVKSIQDQIVNVRGDLGEIADAAAAEVEKNKAISANLATIANDMGEVLAGNKEILTGSDEIVRVVKEVQTGVEQIAAAAQQASRASTEASNAAREQAKGAEELAAAIEEIASLADELQAA
jgi:methyl-accepting chemotaxis protein